MKKELEKIQSFQEDILSQASFDYLSFALIDFNQSQVDKAVIDYWSIKKEHAPSLGEHPLFDLASLTKPLLLGSYFLENQHQFSNHKQLLLEHRAGLPAYGVLSKKTWREQIRQYEIGESATLYSDYSSLRLMMEIGEKNLYEHYSSAIPELKNWLELSDEDRKICPPTGFRNGQIIQGDVHDPNAFTISEFTSHSGLFSRIYDLCAFLWKLEKRHQFIDRHLQRDKLYSARAYFEGWEGISHPQKTLAGAGCSSDTFGFLGFSGTSVWIDPQKKIGWVLLTNATQKYWHNRSLLNHLRRQTGQLVWPLFH